MGGDRNGSGSLSNLVAGVTPGGGAGAMSGGCAHERIRERRLRPTHPDVLSAGGIQRIMETVLGTSILRLIHTLGGCGGTLLSRCIAVLPGVALLSEVNPAAVKLLQKFDPLYQDAHWLHLLTPEDVDYFSGLDLRDIEHFRALIQVFHDRACASGRHLVIRDYNYIDFIGAPFNPAPPRSLSLYAALPQSISTVSLLYRVAMMILSPCFKPR